MVINSKSGCFGGMLLVLVMTIGSVLISCVCMALIFFGIFSTIKSSDIYTLALKETQNNPQAIETLGTPIEPGWWVSGSIEVNTSSGYADLAIPVSGPKDSGTVYVVAIKSAGVWEITTLDLAPNASESRINMLGGR